VLTKAEKYYSTIEREPTAIVWACRQFRPYIWGRKFTIITDHKPLTWIFKMNDPNSRIMRMNLKLEEFDYTIIYKKGKENSNSDWLSRMYSYIATTEGVGAALTSGVGEEEETGTSETLNAEDGKSEETVVKNAKLTEKEKLEILKELHESPIGGHGGMNRTYKRRK
jgi:hypothetical protein